MSIQGLFEPDRPSFEHLRSLVVSRSAAFDGQAPDQQYLIAQRLAIQIANSDVTSKGPAGRSQPQVLNGPPS